MEEIKENRLGTTPIPKLLASMSLPLMLSMLIQSLYNIVDGIYVSRLSVDALTATTLAFPLQQVLIAVSVGTGVGINSLLARRLGEKKFDEVNNIACQGLVLSLINTLVFILLGFFAVRPFIKLFTAEEGLIRLGTDYLSICFIFSFGAFFAMINERMLQATGHAVLSMISQGIGAIANIILDPIMIFGRLGCPAMGIKGAAAATVIGQILSAVFATFCNIKYNSDIRFDFKNYKWIPKQVGEVYSVGVPAMIMQCIGSVTSVCMNKILISSSQSAVSVYGVYFKLNSFIFMPIFGLNQGSVPIVAYNYGARRPARIKETIRDCILATAVIMAVGLLVFQIIPGKLLMMFSADDEMLSVGIRAMRIVSFTFIPAGISIILGNALQGIGNGTVSMANSILRQIVFLIPSAFILNKAFGVDYVWFAFLIAEVVSLTFTLVMFTKVYNKKVAPMMSEN